MKQINVFGAVGTGVIGTGWIIRALQSGLRVTVWDPAPDAPDKLLRYIEQCWPTLEKNGHAAPFDASLLHFAQTLEECVGAADFIQESVPEQLELKRSLHARMSQAAAADTLISSSTSGLLPSEFYADVHLPGRCMVGHPFNPVYLLPLVEVVASRYTTDESVAAACSFYRQLGMRPLVVQKEVPGFVADRLLEALWREALHLVNDGVATTGEIDDAIRFGAGLRWSFMGTFLTYSLAGGDAGMRHFMAQFGPALKLPWTHLEAPQLTDELIDRVVEGTSQQMGSHTITELERFRDDALIAVESALAKVRREYGMEEGR